jgi:hypothetical protein
MVYGKWPKNHLVLGLSPQGKIELRLKKDLVSKKVEFQAALQIGAINDVGKPVSCDVKVKDKYIVP